MKQVVQNYKSGELTLLDVPGPTCRPGGVVVRTEYSLVSTGTERMKVAESRMSLAGMARARPDQVRKVLDTVTQQGVMSTYRKVMNRLDSYTPLGYSVSGIVTEVGEGAPFEVGQRVACGGNQYAHHAEYNWVPTNLCVPVPESVDAADAAFTTVGAIALQAFRQSEARLGEVSCVIGLGLIGQLLVQILRSAGVNVVGIDPSDQRRELAQRAGAAATSGPGAEERAVVTDAVARMTDGAGADHVFLAAATDDRGPLFTAAELLRDRGRIVDVGKCNLDLPWDKYYEKELDVRFSRSYGPGRYDPVYEEGGVDYPIGYVRWTERRNMKAFLELVADGRVDLGRLEPSTHAFEDAVGVYDDLDGGEIDNVAVVFRYPAPSVTDAPPAAAVHRTVPAPRPALGRVGVGVIGAGNYASTMLLPHLAANGDVALRGVATTTALSGATAQSRFGFELATTDYRQVLADDAVDAVVIATRHATHAELVVEALLAGKSVFVEKPLAVNEAQLAGILRTVAETGNDRLQVGFNRRFAPLLNKMRDVCGDVRGPSTLTYEVRAGALASDSWYGQTDTQGTRFVGEGCHFIDTASWWLGSDPIDVVATAAPGDPDHLVCTLRYPDGSTASIAYLTGEAPRRYPKETMTVHAAGRTARLSNYSQFEVWRGRRRTWRRSLKSVDKGQAGEMAAFIEAVRTGSPMPITVESLATTTMATFLAHESASSGTRIPVVLPRADG